MLWPSKFTHLIVLQFVVRIRVLFSFCFIVIVIDCSHWGLLSFYFIVFVVVCSHRYYLAFNQFESMVQKFLLTILQSRRCLQTAAQMINFLFSCLLDHQYSMYLNIIATQKFWTKSTWKILKGDSQPRPPSYHPLKIKLKIKPGFCRFTFKFSTGWPMSLFFTKNISPSFWNISNMGLKI